jgi:hypothetical protein
MNKSQTDQKNVTFCPFFVFWQSGIIVVVVSGKTFSDQEMVGRYWPPRGCLVWWHLSHYR